MKKNFRIDNDQLKKIRSNTDWRKLFDALAIRKDKNRSRPGDWWGWSPFAEEKTPSFHMGDKGFFCFSSNESGGVIELVQKVIGKRTGQALNCYEAGAWLLDNGISALTGEDRSLPAPDGSRSVQPENTDRSEKEKERETKENKPIRQNLIPLLSELGTHPELIKRGISKKTCEYLGCGYLAPVETKSQALQKMQGRIVFQIRGVNFDKNGDLRPVVLSHIGRALEDEKIITEGKWRSYSEFFKTFELYNLDQVLLDPEAKQQAQQTGHVLILEGCFDVAKLVEANILNVVATFGSHLDEDQLPKIKLIAEQLNVNKFCVWYDRDDNQAGQKAQEKVIELLKANGFDGHGFDWDMKFNSPLRGLVQIPSSLNDPGIFLVDQLQWLRKQEVI